MIKGDSLSYHLGMQFSTKDHDKDMYWDNCAELEKGGWWYKACSQSNLNGRYIQGGKTNGDMSGITWATWKGDEYSLKSVVMKISRIIQIETPV